jgi:hypothetical protein
MEFTDEQLELIKSENQQVVFELNGAEVLAFFSLGQMHKKVVRMTDNFFGNTKVGVFLIEELNGETELDFSNPDDWTTLDIKSVTFSLTSPNMWGHESSRFSDIFNIKSIALLK